jgi:hypothetical protein
VNFTPSFPRNLLSLPQVTASEIAYVGTKDSLCLFNEKSIQIINPPIASACKIGNAYYFDINDLQTLNQPRVSSAPGAPSSKSNSTSSSSSCSMIATEYCGSVTSEKIEGTNLGSGAADPKSPEVSVNLLNESNAILVNPNTKDIELLNKLHATPP